MTISRRTVAKGGLWASPVVLATTQVPLYAASSSICQNDAVTPLGVQYELVGAENNQTTPYQNGLQVNLKGDGKTTWSENPGYKSTFSYLVNRDLSTTILRVYISGSYYNGGTTHEGRIANIIDRSFSENAGYTYSIDDGTGELTEVRWLPGQIGQIRDAATATASTLPDGAYAGYAINHLENQRIFEAYDKNQVAGELRLYFKNMTAGSRITLTVYSRFAELNDYNYMAQTFNLDEQWHRPVLNAGLVSSIHFKESGERGDASGNYCVQSLSQAMSTYDGDLTDELPLWASLG